MASQGKLIQFEIDQLVLDLKNARHEPVKKQEDAMKALLGSEQVVQMALSIAKQDANPMELMGLVEKKGTGTRKTFISLEGNRRTCAYLLLLDPERVPAGVSNRQSIIKKLEKAAAEAAFTRRRNGILFKSRAEAQPWIDIMHINDQDGTSRRRWSADQRERASGGGRNKKAMSVLDLAQAFELFEKSDREKKLTTVQRYIGNANLRELFGWYFDTKNRVITNRSDADAKAIFEAFMAAVRDGTLSSRSNSKQVVEFSEDLIDRLGLGDDRYEERLLANVLATKADDDGGNAGGAGGSHEPSGGGEDGAGEEAELEEDAPPAKRTKIGINQKLELRFHHIKSEKLLSLYRSCCNLHLGVNTPLITVGLWSILETLAGLHNEEEVKFEGYFSADRITKAGFQKGAGRKEIRAAITRISENGNSTKHSMTAASFDGNQLANDVDVLVPFMIAICDQILDAIKAG